MDTLIKGIGLAVIGILLLTFAAVVGGTIVWLIWPVVIPAVFPAAVIAGTIPATLSWWISVCLTWLCSLLIKPNTSHTSKS